MNEPGKHRARYDDAPLRFRSAISSSGVLTELATIKLPTAEADTRAELEYLLGERRGVSRMQYFASADRSNVVKGRFVAGTRAYVDLFTYPALNGQAEATPPSAQRLPSSPRVLRASCLRNVHHPDMQRRLADYDSGIAATGEAAIVHQHGAKGSKELCQYFEAVMIVEVEGLPEAVRRFKPPSGWQELTGRKEWSACSIALNGWPTVMVE